MSNFWDTVLLMVSTFFFIAYLIVLFQVVVDLFRDSEMGGGSKVIWLIGLIWIIVFYVSGQNAWPVPQLGSWNILVGFGIMFIGFLMTTRWR